jgi:8-oxo-dGTP diphosphatase
MPRRVLASVMESNGRLLLCRRPAEKRHGGLWEFPGGKVRRGESDLEAVSRELEEELGVEATRVEAVEFSAPDPGSDFVVEFLPVDIRGIPRCLEHSALKWVKEEELLTLPLAPSDYLYARFRLQGRVGDDMGAILDAGASTASHPGPSTVLVPGSVPDAGTSTTPDADANAPDFGISPPAGLHAPLLPCHGDSPLQTFRPQVQRWEAVWGLPGLSDSVTVEFSGRLRSSFGNCRSAEGKIRLAERLRNGNRELLEEILCHELAHVAVHRLCGPRARPHGPEWRSLMVRAGFKPRARIKVEELEEAPAPLIRSKSREEP